eukprot:CAMPEP_0168555266 /NCGR_PEP_ID=MMETSP0413-20121227/8238_1 /TAXON_ID=136452 /ORGANISM="Filamoeba nolandi, Strain NC-AS-23-1" /LENGTH=159 /DNA_ID=CAMNT_0008586095 /DNA_START=754 /DNA_END=1230 /DNA_ORIENTATION=-
MDESTLYELSPKLLDGCITALPAFVLDDSLEQSSQFQLPKHVFQLDSQPEPFQRKSYPNSKRKEFRYFKPAAIRVVPLESLQFMIRNGTAIMQIVDDSLQPVEDEPAQVCEISNTNGNTNNNTKQFHFTPMAMNTSKGQQYRLKFTINVELNDGEQKTE